MTDSSANGHPAGRVCTGGAPHGAARMMPSRACVGRTRQLDRSVRQGDACRRRRPGARAAPERRARALAVRGRARSLPQIHLAIQPVLRLAPRRPRPVPGGQSHPRTIPRRAGTAGSAVDRGPHPARTQLAERCREPASSDGIASVARAPLAAGVSAPPRPGRAIGAPSGSSARGRACRATAIAARLSARSRRVEQAPADRSQHASCARAPADGRPGRTRARRRRRRRSAAEPLPPAATRHRPHGRWHGSRAGIPAAPQPTSTSPRSPSRSCSSIDRPPVTPGASARAGSDPGGRAMALAKARIEIEHTGEAFDVMFNPEEYTLNRRTTTSPRRRPRPLARPSCSSCTATCARSRWSCSSTPTDARRDVREETQKVVRPARHRLRAPRAAGAAASRGGRCTSAACSPVRARSSSSSSPTAARRAPVST